MYLHILYTCAHTCIRTHIHTQIGSHSDLELENIMFLHQQNNRILNSFLPLKNFKFYSLLLVHPASHCNVKNIFVETDKKV